MLKFVAEYILSYK